MTRYPDGPARTRTVVMAIILQEALMRVIDRTQADKLPQTGLD
jgi:hypothetical protein